MTTTVQQIFEAALQWSVANPDVFRAASTREILERVNADHQALFSKLADEDYHLYSANGLLLSTAGPSGRTVDLATLLPPVEAVIAVRLPNGEEVFPVDVGDQEAELAPRYYQQGDELVEINNEWGAAGAVSLALVYAYRPEDVDRRRPT